MKELKWKEIHENRFSLETGNIQASCWHESASTWGRKWWFASVQVLHQFVECGPKRRSLAKAQKDAARMIEEQLLDLSIGVAQELKNYGIEHDSETR